MAGALELQVHADILLANHLLLGLFARGDELRDFADDFSALAALGFEHDVGAHEVEGVVGGFDEVGDGVEEGHDGVGQDREAECRVAVLLRLFAVCGVKGVQGGDNLDCSGERFGDSVGVGDVDVFFAGGGGGEGAHRGARREGHKLVGRGEGVGAVDFVLVLVDVLKFALEGGDHEGRGGAGEVGVRVIVKFFFAGVIGVIGMEVRGVEGNFELFFVMPAVVMAAPVGAVNVRACFEGMYAQRAYRGR